MTLCSGMGLLHHNYPLMAVRNLRLLPHNIGVAVQDAAFHKAR